MSLQHVEGQGVPYIPVKSRTRHFFGMAKFSLGGALCRIAEFRTPTAIILFKLATKAQHDGVRSLVTKNGKNGTLTGGKTKSGVTKGKNDNNRFTLRIASGN